MSARRIVSLWLALLAAPVGVSAQLPQNSPDELVQALNSRDWRIRSDAVARLAYMPADQRPANYPAAMIALINREGTNPPDPETRRPGEGYGEYLLHLVRAVVDLQDSRALRGLVLVGSGTSRRTNEFIATHGDAVLPHLEEAWRRREKRHDVLKLSGLMLGEYAERVSPENRAMLVRRILDARTADPQGFFFAARNGHLTSLTPLVEQIAADTSLGSIVRRGAARVASDLRAVRASLPPQVRVQQVADLLGALCIGPTGTRARSCRELSLMLAGPDTPDQKLDGLRNHLEADSSAVWSRVERLMLTQ